jgi:HlyD family secretion protein
MSLLLSGPNKLPVLRRKPDSVGELIGAFESDTVGVFRRTAPVNEHTVLWVFSTMLLLAVALSCFIKVDRVVTSVYGIIVTSAGSLYVSPLNPSVVRSVNVKVGQVVKQGQALAMLDPTFTQADLLQLQEHLASDVATVNREEAEIAQRPYLYSKSDRYEVIQGGLWEQRQAAYHSNIANYDGQIASAEAQMLQAKSDAEKYTKRLQLITEEQNVYEPLLDKGYVSKLQVLESTDATTEMSRLLADAQNEIVQYRETIASLKGQRAAYIQQWFSDTAAQLVLDRNDLDLTVDSRDKAQKLQDLNSLDSPTDAIVVKIGKLSPGSVAPGQGTDTLTPGVDPLFTLAPLGAPVEAEVDVATTDVAFISVGDPVQIKLDAYSFVLYGIAKGKVTSISEGSFSTDANNTPVPPYFKVRVRVTETNLHDVPTDFRLIPGMTLEGDIMVGERTIMSYLVETILSSTEPAMREPQ